MPQTPYEARRADEIEAAAKSRELTPEESAEYQRLARISFLRKVEIEAERKKHSAARYPFAEAAEDMLYHGSKAPAEIGERVH